MSAAPLAAASAWRAAASAWHAAASMTASGTALPSLAPWTALKARCVTLNTSAVFAPHTCR
jgi:hypothetical protein